MIWPLTLALNAKSAGLVGGGLVLVTVASFGFGYWKGSAARAAAPVTTQTQTESQSNAKLTKDTDSKVTGKSDEDVVERRITSPPQVLADGSTVVDTRIRRTVAREETAKTSEATASTVHEKLDVRRTDTPCPAAAPGPALPNPFAVAPAPPVPRWMAGPSVGRDFSIDKTVFGGSLAARLGPVWLRLAADSHPQVVGSVEVAW